MSHKFQIANADDIVQSTQLNELIIEAVQNILTVLEDHIKTAIQNRRSQTGPVEIQTHFDFPSMTNARAQRYVYYHLIKALKEAKYMPNMTFYGDRVSNQKVCVNVQWVSREDVKMEAEMDRYIQSSTKQLPDVAGMAGTERKALNKSPSIVVRSKPSANKR